MNKWIKRAESEIGMPMALAASDKILYRLVGDAEPRLDLAGNLAWDGVDGEGRVEAWARPDGVGDVNGTTLGSGARFNAGKPDLSLIPAGVIGLVQPFLMSRPAGAVDWGAVLIHLGAFQMRAEVPGLPPALFMALAEMDDDGQMWAECARVFDYGRAKYSAWNWARGQAWSIPIASAMRHIVLGLMRGEVDDPESGLPHRGHVACNIVMLLWFLQYYLAGDDRYQRPVCAA